LKLIFEGESATDKLAAVLGLDALQPDVQRRQVKRERDRLIKALERLGKKLTDEQP
jgi:RNA polymerase sigma-70 factor (ECF subfamily)